MLFHRDFRQFQGGHLKVWHYFNHVKATPGYEAKIFFTPESVWDPSNPWFSLRQEALDSYDYRRADMLFVAGQDWLALPEESRKHPTVPVVNFLQHVRHADRETFLYSYLIYPALRIAVSEEVGAAVSATGRANGPVVCIPNGISLEELPPPVPWPQRDVDVVVCALKNRALGGAVRAAAALSASAWRRKRPAAGGLQRRVMAHRRQLSGTDMEAAQQRA